MSPARRTSLLHVLLAAVAVLGLPMPAAAQEAPADGEAETGRRYAVEVIIFEYTQLDSVGTEVFVPERLPEEPADDGFLEPPPAATEGPQASAPPAEAPPADDFEFRPLAEDELALSDTRDMLVRLQAYEPLMHFGWVQATVPDAPARPLDLARFGTPPPGLNGTLALSLSRFLHLGVDLTLAADEAYVPPPQPAAPAAGDLRVTPSGQPRTVPRFAPLVYELAETRIIRSGETRYYDHPHFGVIARVTRADEPDAATAGGRR